jgi:hypothetical protein
VVIVPEIKLAVEVVKVIDASRRKAKFLQERR